MNKKRIIEGLLSVFIALVFVQSLFFKFTGSAETQYIFGTLDSWASGLGFPGLFVPPGPFNAYVIGSAELVASVILIAGFFLRKDILSGFGAVMAMGIISGAIFFHLFTPLGIEVMGDGGTLFFMACGIWVSSAILIVMNRSALLALICRGCISKSSAENGTA